MLKTDAWAYLNIHNPVCAWAAYRSSMVSAPENPGFLSVWTAAMVKSKNVAWLNREQALEDRRQRYFPQRVSRLKGMFCFTDLASAEWALQWGSAVKHFRPDFLSELSLAEASPERDRLDSNWITYAKRDEQGFPTDHEWIHRYWSGDPFPGKEPVWETLVRGRLLLLGTELRQRAYALLEKHMPQSLSLAEIGRLGAAGVVSRKRFCLALARLKQAEGSRASTPFACRLGHPCDSCDRWRAGQTASSIGHMLAAYAMSRDRHTAGIGRYRARDACLTSGPTWGALVSN
jgi:hypothetical protein